VALVTVGDQPGDMTRVGEPAWGSARAALAAGAAAADGTGPGRAERWRGERSREAKAKRTRDCVQSGCLPRPALQEVEAALRIKAVNKTVFLKSLGVSVPGGRWSICSQWDGERVEGCR